MMLQKYPVAKLPSWRLSEVLEKDANLGAMPGLSSSGPVQTGELLASLSQIGVLAHIHSSRVVVLGGCYSTARWRSPPSPA